MRFNLTGKTALITGSSKGIGLAIAKALHSEGCKIALNSRNSNELSHAAEQLSGSIALVGDMTLYHEAQRVINEAVNFFGKLDIVVCNVGNSQSVLPGKETPEEWQRIFALNLWSVTNIIESAQDVLSKSKGNFVCISSICGVERIEGAPITYSTAKAALNAYVRGISRPLGKKGVRINVIAPGNILFENSIWTNKLSKNKIAVKNMLKNNVSLNSFGAVEDVANLAVYLASDLASFATGSIWVLDGGQIHS